MSKENQNINYEPDVTNIHEGMEVKNYIELCKLLNQEPVTNHSRTSQKKTWERYFEFETIGQKYYIGQIYDEPIPKSVKDGSVYVPLIETLFAALLSRQEGEHLRCRYNFLLDQFNMVNPRYKELSLGTTYGSIKDYIDDNGNAVTVDKDSYNDFRVASYSRFLSILKSSLNSMKSRKLLSKVEDEVVVVTTVVQPGYEDYDFEDPIRKYHIATEAETNQIVEIERHVLREMGANSVFQINARGQWGEYSRRVDEKLSATNPTWVHVFRQLHVMFSHNTIDDGLKESRTKFIEKAEEDGLVVDEHVVDTMVANMLNENVMNAYLTSSQKKYNKLSKQGKIVPDNIMGEENKMKHYLFKSQYMDDQIYLADIFIKNRKKENHE